MARSEIKVAKEEPLSDRDFDALPEYEDSTDEEIHALIENEKMSGLSFEEYGKRRRIKL